MAIGRSLQGPAVLAGRSGEIARLRRLVEGAAAGTFGALLLSGDAGVGKTALVQHAQTYGVDGTVFVHGACLPLSSMTVPLHVLRAACEAASRREPGIPPLAVSYGDAPEAGLEAFDRWLNDLCAQHPVVLTIDDLQWADASTLDVLMWVMAGSHQRPVLVLATLRSSEVIEGHRLHRWLADVRRFPAVEELSVGPLDRVETAQQLHGLLGRPPRQSLVEDVYTRTQGNAYLNQLAVRGLDPDASALQSQMSGDLKEALLQNWHSLSRQARRLTTVLAIGGHRAGPDELPEFAELASATLRSALLAECVQARVLDCDEEGRYWFHHPMQAEALEQSLAPGQRRELHAIFARHWESRVDPSKAPTVEVAATVADHHDRAGHLAPAYQWSVLGAAAAAEVGAVQEQVRLLRRAGELASSLPEAAESSHRLLEERRRAAEAAGLHEDELDAVNALLDSVEGAEEPPLARAVLMIRRILLHFMTGTPNPSPLVDLDAALELSSAFPESWQHSYVLTEAAKTNVWMGETPNKAWLDEALRVARLHDNPAVLSYALAGKAVEALFWHRDEDTARYGAEAIEAAARARDFFAFVTGCLFEAGAEDWRPDGDPMALSVRRRQQLEELGAPHAYLAWMSAAEAGGMLRFGRWQEAEERLRVALGSRPGWLGDINARLAAARLAVLQGRTQEARAHLARARELFGPGMQTRFFECEVVEALVCLAEGDPEGAYTATMAGVRVEHGQAPLREWLLPLAARALADLAQAARDAGESPHETLQRVDDLVRRFPRLVRQLEGPSGSAQADSDDEALMAMYDAEIRRARGVRDTGAQWSFAADQAHREQLPWEEAYCCWRAAEAMLLDNHRRKADPGPLLRRGLGLARELRAAELESELTGLASSARVSVRDVDHEAGDEHRAPVPGLTAREEEILAHIVAGRTYHEIARELSISEKTVSSHVSHLLAKSGAPNRVGLAALVARGAATRGASR